MFICKRWEKSAAKMAQFTACNGREKEGKAIHSFNTHPKPPYGSQIQCSNMLQKIQRHPKALGTRSSAKVGKTLRPVKMAQFTACNGREKEGKAIHSFNTHPKPPYGSQIQCSNMLQKIQRHPTVLGTRLCGMWAKL